MEKQPNGYKCLSCNINLFGQRRKWCDTDCQKAGPFHNPKTCGYCHKELPPKARKWCSHECNARATNKTGKLAHELAPTKLACICCGVAIPNSSPSEAQRFCSYKCRGKTRSLISKESIALQKIADAWKQKHASLVQGIKAERTLRVFTCLTCNAQRIEGKGYWKKYCSDKCKPKPKPCKPNKNLESYKRHKKAWRLRRKALERGATVSQKFHPFEVFDRDGWKCQICGIKTPKELRGSYKPNAPELDHIIPISKGGQHTMTNSQTSCRSCNGAKSNKDSRGQMGLFTALLGSQRGAGAVP